MTEHKINRLPSLVKVPKHEREPMTEKQSEIFTSLYMMRDHETMVPAKQLEVELNKIFEEAFVKSFVLQVMIRRLVLTPSNLRYSPLAVAFCATLCNTPGLAVMWAYTLFDETNRFQEVTMDRLADLFPMGFPTGNGYRNIWDAQKGMFQTPPVKIDNLLDTSEAWQ